MQRWLLVVVTIAVLGSGLYWSIQPAPAVKSPAVVEVTKDRFTTKITELGELRALDSVTVSSPTLDTPITALIPEGSRVTKDQVLARLDPSKYEVYLEQGQAEVQIARAELRKAEKDLEVEQQHLLANIARLEDEVQLARIKLEQLRRKPLPEEVEKARIELEKAEVAFSNAERKQRLLPTLVAKGFIAQDTLDKAKLDYVQGKADLQKAQVNLSMVSAGATPEELTEARVRLRQATSESTEARHGMKPKLESFEAAVDRAKAYLEKAENAVDKAMERLERTVLRAPRDGLVVYDKSRGRTTSNIIQLGMIPYRGQPLFHLPDLSTMVVDTEVNELDIGKMRVGGPVEVRLEAYPGDLFQGRVMHIASLARNKRSPSGSDSGIKIFDVTVKIETSDVRLRPGLTATVNFITGQQEDTIAIPLTAVSSQQGEHVVFVANGGKPEARTVTLGTSNVDKVVVKTGLRAGERILLSRP